MKKAIASLIILLAALSLIAGCSGSATSGLPPEVTPGNGTFPLPGDLNNNGKGVVTGKVIDYETTVVIKNAEVVVDSGQSAKTAEGGTFTLNDVRGGTRILIVTNTMAGYAPMYAQVTVANGQTTEVTISLKKAGGTPVPDPTPTPSPTPSPETGTLIIQAYSEEANSGNFVVRISVTDEDEAGSYFWYDTWSSQGLDNYKELTCQDAIIGHHFEIVANWNNGTEYSRDWVEFDYDDQIIEILYPSRSKKK